MTDVISNRTFVKEWLNYFLSMRIDEIVSFTQMKCIDTVHVSFLI